MIKSVLFLTTTLGCGFLSTTTAFMAPRAPSHPTTALFNIDAGVIRGIQDDSEILDVTAGGVQLSTESVLEVFGDIQVLGKNQESEADFSGLNRYFKFTEIDESTAKASLEQMGATIVAAGEGQEIYFDPGEGTEKRVQYGPDDAVNKALASNPALGGGKNKVVVNFLGGDDLQVREVLFAAQKIVDGLEVPKGPAVSYNSVSHNTIPGDVVTVTVVELDAMDDEKLSGLKGVEKMIALGKVFLRGGKYCTVTEEDINDALE